MAETKTSIARESLEDSWESLSKTMLKVKSERDALLEACQFALSELENMKSQDFTLGRDQAVRDKLRSAIYLGR